MSKPSNGGSPLSRPKRIARLNWQQRQRQSEGRRRSSSVWRLLEQSKNGKQKRQPRPKHSARQTKLSGSGKRISRLSRNVRKEQRQQQPSATIQTHSGSLAQLKSTPGAALGSGSSTSRRTISCATKKSCSPSMTAPGRDIRQLCSRRSPINAPRHYSL